MKTYKKPQMVKIQVETEECVMRTSGMPPVTPLEP